MLRLGSQTGSLENHLQSRYVSPEPVVGMGCTLLAWTDRHAATVKVVLLQGKLIIIQEDIATRIDKNGMSESQDYTYASDDKGTVHVFKKVRGGWREMEMNDKTHRYNLKYGGLGLCLGERDAYYDYSF